uniref:Uncharacterized protein n=1 Tax=Arundo donax TaxID=35708 RepID=A0A0A9A717_ARUDO
MIQCCSFSRLLNKMRPMKFRFAITDLAQGFGIT